MNDSPQTKSHEIRDLIELFRQALVLVGPLAEEAGVSWLREPPYDDWDAATEGLFRSFLSSALENSNHARATAELPRYGFEPAADRVFLAVEHLGQEFGFVRFAGGDQTISKVVVLNSEKGAKRVLPWAECDLYLKLPDGSRIRRIEVTT